MQQAQVLVEDYQQEYGCITVDEARWILHRCGRHTPYYTYFLLRMTTGIRGHELLEVQINQLRDGMRTLMYRVDKPKVRKNRYGELQETRKIRTVQLDPWVTRELIAYCERYMVVQTHPDGTHSYLSPYNNRGKTGLLFPWKGADIVLAYWNKLRHKAHAAGFDAHRLERQYIRLEPSRRIMDDKTYIWRPHMLRHFYCSVMLARLGCHKAVAKDIRHSGADTTWTYCHAPSELGRSLEELRTLSWAQLFGYDEGNQTLPVRDMSQTVLNTFS